MKKSEIEVGKDYAYQYRRNDTDSTYGITRATVTGFTTSYGGAPMVQVDIHRTRWDWDYDENHNRIEDSQKRVDYLEPRKVTLITIVGQYEEELARREALANKRTTEREEYERQSAIRKQWKKDNYDPAMRELIAELSHITRKGYINEDTSLREFDLEQIQAITETLRKVMVNA